MKALEPKYAARTEARARLAYAAEAVERAKRIESAATATVRDLERRAEEAETNHATELAVLIARGGPTAELPATVDDDLASALLAARRDHSVKAKALSKLVDIRADAQADLAAAERAVVQAVDQILTDEIAERAHVVDRLLNEAQRLGVALKYFAVSAQVNASAIVPATALRVLDRLNLPLINALETPINLAQAGDVAAFRDWTQRRTEMIAGTMSDEPKAA